MKAGDSEIIEAFNILGIPLNSSREDIKNSFKNLTIKYHPDKNPGDDKSNEKFRSIKDAYELLIHLQNGISEAFTENRKRKQRSDTSQEIATEKKKNNMQKDRFAFFNRKQTNLSLYYSIDITCTYIFPEISYKKQSNIYNTCFFYEELKNVGFDIENKIKLKTAYFGSDIKPAISIHVTGVVHNANINTQFNSLCDFFEFIEKFCPDQDVKFVRSFN